MKRPPPQDAIALAALALSLLFVFVDQAHDTGLEKGHRGWCSANVLAIIEHATLSNGFVGHTLQFQDEQGVKHYDYFDRYPVFFSAAMHVVLNTVELSRGEQIYVARQAMNVLYALSVSMAVAFLWELGFRPALAVGAAALAASGKILVAHRDMIHFDHAALLGFMTLLWALARWYRTRNDRLIYFATAFGVCMGRGYASFAILGVWWIIEAVIAARTSKAAVKQLVFGTATRACLLGIALGAACLSYNIWREAEKNNVAWTEVGIVDSAMRRLVLKEEEAKQRKKQLAWGRFAEVQTARFVSNAQPLSGPRFETKDPRTTALLTVLGLGIVVAFIATRKRELRPVMIVAALCGIAWIIGMRGLTAFHSFTSMFLLPTMTLLMMALVHWVPRRVALVVALVGCFFLVRSTSHRNRQLEKTKAKAEVYTKDLARIDEHLKPGEAFEVHPQDRKKLVPGVPYALGWFLPENFILRKAAKGPFLLTTKKDMKDAGENLTPSNKKLFLYRKPSRG